MPYSNKEKSKEYRHEWYLRHREERLAVSRRRNVVHREEIKKYDAVRYKKNKLIVINYYGGKCSFCGDTNINHLCIDHINNNGAAHRKIVNTSAMALWIIKNNFPDGFQILCYTHNAEKQFSKTMTEDTFG